MRKELFFTASWLLLTGCGTAQGERSAVRDSADMRVVENGAHSDGRHVTWSVEEHPDVVIGARDGGSGHDLFRAVAAARMSDGRIVVANAGSFELRSFDSRGGHIGSFGRRGDGPGEFRSLFRVDVLAGDTIAAWDADLNRLSIFSPAGEFVRSVSVAGLDGVFPQLHGIFEDGSLVLSTGLDVAGAFQGGGGVWSDSAAFLRVAADGTVRDTIGRFPSSEQFTVPPPSGRGTFLVESLPFGRRTVTATAGMRLFVGEGKRYEVAAYDAGGTPRMLVRKQFRPRPVRTEDVRHYHARRTATESASTSTAEEARIRSAIPYPREMPPYAALVVDAAEHLWVRESAPPADERVVWSVFSPTGVLVGSASLPANLIVHQIGESWVLGARRGEEGVEQVVLFRLTRG